MYDVFHVENLSTSDTLCIRFLEKCRVVQIFNYFSIIMLLSKKSH